MVNRAYEFLSEAYNLLAYWGNHEKARLLVRLALGEVEELQDRLAAFEGARLTSPTSPTSQDGRGVLVVDAQPMTPARLTEGQSTAAALEWQRRAALPGNNHKRG